ncbi:MAG: hypothetical protein ABI654_11385 [Betaproteobacteria bacterium]
MHPAGLPYGRRWFRLDRPGSPMFHRSLVPLFALLVCADGRAQAPAENFQPQVWINPGVYSYHFDRSKGYRENNTGLGAELLLGKDHLLAAASIINSDRQRSRLAAYQWRPLHWQVSGVNVSAGVAVAVMDGYPRYRNGGWFVAPLPMLAVEGEGIGLNVIFVPSIPNRVSGAIAFQAKLRVW